MTESNPNPGPNLHDPRRRPAPRTDREGEPHAEMRIIALMNQKGGVGKTTTTTNLGAALAARGRRVLLIDLDPQAHLTLHLGIDPGELELGIYDLLTGAEGIAPERLVHHIEGHDGPALGQDGDEAAGDGGDEVAPQAGGEGRADESTASVDFGGARASGAGAGFPETSGTSGGGTSRGGTSGGGGSGGAGGLWLGAGVPGGGGGLWLVPGDVNLAGIESELAGQTATGKAQRRLKHRCLPLLQAPPPSPSAAAAQAHRYGGGPPGRAPYDYVLIDCPPSLGLLTINALTLAREVIVPMQTHFLALQGLSKLLETVFLVSQSFNPPLSVAGVVLCMHEQQTLLANEVVADLNGFLDTNRSLEMPWSHSVIYQPPIRRNVKLAECPSFGQTIFQYAAHSNGAGDYLRLAASVEAHRAHLDQPLSYTIGPMVGEVPEPIAQGGGSLTGTSSAAAFRQGG